MCIKTLLHTITRCVKVPDAESSAPSPPARPGGIAQLLSEHCTDFVEEAYDARIWELERPDKHLRAFNNGLERAWVSSREQADVSRYLTHSPTENASTGQAWSAPS